MIFEMLLFSGFSRLRCIKRGGCSCETGKEFSYGPQDSDRNYGLADCHFFYQSGFVFTVDRGWIGRRIFPAAEISSEKGYPGGDHGNGNRRERPFPYGQAYCRA